MRSLTLAVTSLLLICTSCDRDRTEAPPKTKTEILTSGKWLVVSSEAVTQGPGSPTTSDLLKDLPQCQKDNLYIFGSNGAGAIDEGATKCDSSAPQVVNTGNWELRDNEKNLKMRVKFDQLDADIVSQILELNDNSMTLKIDTSFLSFPTTITSVFTHIKQ